MATTPNPQDPKYLKLFEKRINTVTSDCLYMQMAIESLELVEYTNTNAISNTIKECQDMVNTIVQNSSEGIFQNNNEEVTALRDDIVRAVNKFRRELNKTVERTEDIYNMELLSVLSYIFKQYIAYTNVLQKDEVPSIREEIKLLEADTDLKPDTKEQFRADYQAMEEELTRAQKSLEEINFHEEYDYEGFEDKFLEYTSYEGEDEEEEASSSADEFNELDSESTIDLGMFEEED